MGKEKSRGKRGKVSRFRLGREGELVLAAMGLIFVLGAVAFFGWSAISKFLLKPDPAKIAAEQALHAEQSARVEALLQDGTILRMDEARTDLYVDAVKWETLGLSGQGEATKAIAGHFGWKHCFVYDAATGTQLGWYTKAEGYKMAGKR